LWVAHFDDGDLGGSIFALQDSMTAPRYHLVVEQSDPYSWGWEICRNGEPLPIRLRGNSHSSERGAERAGAKALRDFLAGLNREQNG
jgi:hypothetical protein